MTTTQNESATKSTAVDATRHAGGIVTIGEREFVMERIFNAPRENDAFERLDDYLLTANP